MSFLESKTREKYAFIYTIVAGLLIHMYALSNHFLTYDSMWNLYSSQDMLSSGRPLLQYACLPTSYYDLTWVNGLLALAYLGIASALIVNLFSIKNKISIVLISLCLVTFPSMTSLFCYSFTMDGYALAILLAVISVFLTIKYRCGFLLGAIFLGISMGIYQAYLSLAILLCLFFVLTEMETKEWKELFVRIFKMLLMGILAFVFYLVSLKIMLWIKNVELSGYQGTNEVFHMNLRNLLMGIKSAYINFIDFARYGGVLAPNIWAKISIVILALCALILLVLFLYRMWRRQGILRVMTAVCMLALLPLATSTISILSPTTFFHILLRYPWVMFLVFGIILVEKVKNYNVNKNYVSVFSTTLMLMISITLFNYAVTANVVYFNMNERYEKTYATTLRLLMKLEETEGYTKETEIAVLGGVLDEDHFETTEITSEITKNYFGSTGVLSVSDSEKFAEFMKHYHGTEIKTVGMIRELELAETEEFKKMGKFPEKSSIQFIDGVLVVKLNG